MSGQDIITAVFVLGVVIWIAELAWLYREARRVGQDPVTVVSGAAVFFVLAIPVARRWPGLTERMAQLWSGLVNSVVRTNDHDQPIPRLVIGGNIYPLGQTRVQIGRFPNNDVVLDHPTVSSYHVEVIPRADGRYEITDRGSLNGTRVNGVSVRSAILRDGDQITVGAISLHYLDRSDVERALQRGPGERRRRNG